MTFALYIGNRGFFPGEVIESARRDMIAAIEASGNFCIYPDVERTAATHLLVMIPMIGQREQLSRLTLSDGR